MKCDKKIRYLLVFCLLLTGTLIFIVLNVCIGTVAIPLEDILASIQGYAIQNERILWDIRMPRAMAALVLGGALALAGYLLQTFFHNHL